MPLPHGPEAALNGLREAVSRLHKAVHGVLNGRGGGEAIWITLSEALYWVAAMDDRYRGDDYFLRRNQDPGGRTAAGLVYARNGHAHELVSAGEAVFEVGSPRVVQIPPGEAAPSPGRGTIFSMQLRWVTLDRLPVHERGEKYGRDVFYQNHIAEQPITRPFDDAIEWLERCITAEASKQPRS
jgi:hypothetical protein